MKDPLIILIVILVVVIVWRGPKTLPQLGEMFGRGVKEAKREASEIKTEMHKDEVAAATTPSAPAAAPPEAPAAPSAPPAPPAPPAPETPGPGGPGPA